MPESNETVTATEVLSLWPFARMDCAIGGERGGQEKRAPDPEDDEYAHNNRMQLTVTTLATQRRARSWRVS